MPWGDGTGPLGRGPMTGRGLGPCGRGFAFRRGFGRGFGWGYRYIPFYRYDYAPAPLTKEEELRILEAELRDIKAEQEAIERRIKELKK